MSQRLSANVADEAHLKETLVRAEAVWQGRFLDVRRDTVALPNGAQTTREYIVHPGAVMVVPMLDDGRLVMERQFRYPLRLVMLEFPAGKIDDGESPFVCGVRELEEETGYRAAEWARAGLLHNAMAYSVARQGAARRRRVPRDRHPQRSRDRGAVRQRRHHRRQVADRPAVAAKVPGGFVAVGVATGALIATSVRSAA